MISSVKNGQPVRRAFADLVASMVRVTGLPPSVGRVFGYLYGSSRPESREEIATSLSLSQGAVSEALKQLTGLGAVVVSREPGARRHLYQVATDVGMLIEAGVTREMRRRFTRESERIRRIEAGLASGEGGPDRELLRERLRSVRLVAEGRLGS